MRSIRALAGVGLLLTAACYSGGEVIEGLAARNPDDSGPTITWDLFAEPLPEIPFPNDIGTRTDVTAPTGRRINVSRGAATQHERDLRSLINGMDGFGTYGPLWLQFDERIDVADIHRRHNNGDPNDDAIYLVNLNPKSAAYGQAMMLDMDSGRYPVVLERTNNYFLNDPRSQGSNLLFETYEEEDTNGNGVLDPLEDTDDDGVWDHPNLWGEVLDDPTRMDPFRDLISFYELETNTLMVRPVFPLDQTTTYGVVVTRRVVGEASQSPVRSPFDSINHEAQTSVLRPLVADGILESLGLELSDVAFTWSFTTQSITRDVEALRAGLYGEGTFARLRSEFPPRISHVPEVEEAEYSDNVHVLEASRLLNALREPQFMNGVGLDPDNAEPIFASYDAYVDRLVLFEYESPAFIENKLGVFDLDSGTGEAEYGRETIYMACFIPKKLPGFQTPFPVVFYSHGYTSSRFEELGFAASHARFGLATCAIDAYGHGLPSADLIIDVVKVLLDGQGLAKLGEQVFASRSRDLNQDGATDSGGDFWGANTFHTRDVVRQTMVDYFQAIRVLRNFGREQMPVDIDGDGMFEVAGDFDADGMHDFGGEQPYYLWGQSLGGIMAQLVGPMEPMITATAPGSGGGGLLDLAIRSTQGGVVQAVYLPFFGPLIAGVPNPFNADQVDLKWNILDINEESEGSDDRKGIRFASVPDPINGELETFQIGDRIRVINESNGEHDEITVRSTDGTTIDGFRMHLPADKGDAVRIEFYRADGQGPWRVINSWEAPDSRIEEIGFQGETVQRDDPLRALQLGFGHRRQTPAFRRLAAFGQMVIDPADPINYAALHAKPVPTRPEGPMTTSVLVVNTNGDTNVPVNTGIAFARAAGLLKVKQIDPRYGKTHDQVLIDTYTIEAVESLRRFAEDPCYRDGRAVLFDIDDASGGVDPTQGPTLTRPTCDGSANAPAECTQVCEPLPPLRATVQYGWGTSGMRMLYLKNTGIHGFAMPEPDLPFDYNVYQINQISWYFLTNGAELVDDVCMAGPSCGLYQAEGIE